MHIPCQRSNTALLSNACTVARDITQAGLLLTLNWRSCKMQAPVTWVDKVSLALVRALQTVIMLALAWHVYAWLSSSISLLAWRYSLAWPHWLALK
jgi:hypothetical protein